MLLITVIKFATYKVLGRSTAEILSRIVTDSFTHAVSISSQRKWFSGAHTLVGAIFSLLNSENLIEYGVRSQTLTVHTLRVFRVNIEENLPPYSLILKVKKWFY